MRVHRKNFARHTIAPLTIFSEIQILRQKRNTDRYAVSPQNNRTFKVISRYPRQHLMPVQTLEFYFQPYLHLQDLRLPFIGVGFFHSTFSANVGCNFRVTPARATGAITRMPLIDIAHIPLVTINVRSFIRPIVFTFHNRISFPSVFFI